MASNLTITYPPATGVSLPQTELVAFDNNSSSTQDSSLNVVAGMPTVVNAVTCYPDVSEQVLKGCQEYPR